MKQKTKIIFGLSIFAIVIFIIFYCKMKRFSDGVNEDAKKKKEFKEKKLNDTTKMIFKTPDKL
jgi:hypothetical protein